MIYSYAPFLFKGDMMKKENIWLIISILLVIIWMVSVFKLSSEVSEVSGNRSGGIISSIIRFFNKNISETKLQTLIEYLQPLVRKIAHFFIYMLMSFWLISFINTYKMRYKTKIVLCTIIGIAYASLDEFHQSFILGRTALISDIIIDTVGILVGIIFFLTIVKIVKYRGNHR